MGIGGLRCKSRRYVLGGYTIWIGLLIGAYYGLPGLRVEAWGLIGLSGVSAIVAGVVINRPARKLPWLLLAAALASFTAGQVSFLVAQLIGTPLPFPSFADVLYLLTYPLYAAGLLIFIWWRTPGRDRRSVIDALTLTVGLALLSWIYLVLPYVHNPGLSWLQKSVAIAYPLGDVLVLAMLARLLAPGTGRVRCVQLLALGIVGVLVSDTAYGLLVLHGTFHNGTVVDLGWAVFYGAWGAAALHPTMTELTQPVTRLRAEVSPVRLIVLMLASLIAPVVLFIESFRFRGEQPERDRGVLRDPLPARALAAVGRGRLAPPRARPGASGAPGRGIPGGGGQRGPGRGRGQVRDRRPARPGHRERRPAARGADRRNVPRARAGVGRPGADEQVR